MLRCQFCRQETLDDQLHWIDPYGYYCSLECAWAWIAVGMLKRALVKGAYPTTNKHFIDQIKEIWGA